VLGKEGAHFAPLPGTALELDAVVAAFRRSQGGAPVTQIRGAAATEAALRLESSARPYLHLATHGYFAPPHLVSALSRPARDVDLTVRRLDDRHTLVGHHPGLLSGLALAGANKDTRGNAGDDGILTALEVAHLDLRAAELVVLSACETGLGRAEGGEGLLGLQQAFQTAGARALVVSLWKVDDAATSVLMEEFYANLWQRKLSKLEALCQAQLTVLGHPERVEARRKQLGDELAKRGLKTEASRPLPDGGKVQGRSHPSLWAAFVLSGDFR
jgi:CHAT domain-containing protein